MPQLRIPKPCDLVISAPAISTELVLLPGTEQTKDIEGYGRWESERILGRVQRQSFIQEFTNFCCKDKRTYNS